MPADSRKGCQEPTFHVASTYAVSMGRYMAEWERTMKRVTLNPWQVSVLDDWLALGPGLKYVHPRNLIMVPRQNGKTEDTFTRIDFGVAVLPLIRKKAGLSFRGERILYSAHEDSTVVEIFMRMQEYYGSKANDPECDYPKLNRMVRAVRKATAKYAIFFKPEYGGGAVYFATRTDKSKIGIAAIDTIICDEAQFVTDTQQAAFLSTTSSAPLANSQFIYLGTPPTPEVKGDVFQSMRDDVVEGRDTGEHGAISLSEWSVNDLVDEGFGDYLDEELWWRLNPSMGYNLQPSAPNVELGMYRQPINFAQQRLGYWLPKTVVEDRFFKPEDWDACVVPESAALGPEDGRCACGVKFTPDGSMLAWSVAVVPKAGAAFVHLVGYASAYGGVDQALDWIERHRRRLLAVLIDGQTGAADFAERVRGLHVPRKRVREASTGDYIDACSMVATAVRQREISHIASPALDESVHAARKRKVGRSGLGLDDGAEVPCAPAESMALALKAAKTARNIDTEGRVA